MLASPECDQAATAALKFAEEEALNLRHNEVGTEHLLLGVLRAPGPASEVLTAAGVTLEAARAAVLAVRGEGTSEDKGLPAAMLSADAKEALALADKLAEGGKCTTGHLLLGLLKAGKGQARKVLQATGAEPEALEREIKFPKAQGGKFKIDRIMFRGAGGPQIWEDGGEMGLDAFAANFYRTRGGTLLGVVARHGNADMVEALLDMGTDINQGNKELGLTPLMFAAIEGHVGVVQLLLEKGADITVADQKGYQAHHCAAECGQPEALKLLLQAGADVSARTHNGMTALHHAVRIEKGHTSWRNRHRKAEVIQLLLDAGADINAECGGNSADPAFGLWTPLHSAAHDDNAEAIAALAEAGADLGAVTSRAQCALIKAAEFGNLTAVRALADAGADLEQPDSQGRTPLLMAAEWGEVAVVSALLSAGANPAAQDVKGCNALHLVAELDDDEHHEAGAQLALMLLKAGARLDAVDNAGRTAEEVAASVGNGRLHKFLKAQRLSPPETV